MWVRISSCNCQQSSLGSSVFKSRKASETQKLTAACLFNATGLLEVTGERGGYVICISLTEYSSEEGVSSSNKRNDCHLD